MSLNFVWWFNSVWNSHFGQYQLFVLQQASYSNFSLIIRSIGLVLFLQASLFFGKSTQDFLLESWLLWFIKAERLLSIFVLNFAFGDFLFAWQNRFLWPSTSLFHESCRLILSWNCIFDLFWSLLPKLSLLLSIVKKNL